MEWDDFCFRVIFILHIPLLPCFSVSNARRKNKIHTLKQRARGKKNIKHEKRHTYPKQSSLQQKQQHGVVWFAVHSFNFEAPTNRPWFQSTYFAAHTRINLIGSVSLRNIALWFLSALRVNLPKTFQSESEIFPHALVILFLWHVD